nr:MAG TPA: hypothetical protein [Caudoviricetes sp.]
MVLKMVLNQLVMYQIKLQMLLKILQMQLIS